MSGYGAVLAYDGTAYQGFQRQAPPTPTIQASVEAALAKVCGPSGGIVAAGRTDAGVHAAGQVIAFDAEWRHSALELLRAVNSQLPRDIALRKVFAAPGFHPRFDALWREYVYRIGARSSRNPLRARYEWQMEGVELDMAGMQAAAETCLGEQDFAAFGTPPQAGSSNTIRMIISSCWTEKATDDGKVYQYRIRGTAFLYHMVRRLVGMMAQVGKGKLTPADFAAILRSRDLQRAKYLAPAQGLSLEAVGYPPQFEAQSAIGETAAETASAPLEDKQ